MTIYHPDANLFPMLPEAELVELAGDISANGLRDSIKLDHTGGFLVDGRNREIACQRAGVEPHYERLPIGTDIFSYVVSVNLRRRHLTDAQRRDIIREIAKRNPTLSNRQIAKLADVSHSTVNDSLGSTGRSRPVEHKTTGADGKSRPASGQISSETRAAIIADLKGAPAAQRDVALKHGVSVGTVAGIKHKLKQVGELPTARRPTIAEQLAKRATNLPRYDTMTREERGMGSREYGAEQHPDYPKGWTRDDVHREKYGRIQLFTPKEHDERQLVKRFEEVILALNRIVTDPPSADDLASINYKSREAIEFQLSKFGPRIVALISDYLAKITLAEAS